MMPWSVLELKMASEIPEKQENESHSCNDSKEAEKIRQIINYQKTLQLFSLSSSSLFSSARKNSSLLNLMKGGSTSLRRLFDMEHISLDNYLKDYSVSPIIRPIFLWGSESDDIIHDDPWADMKQIGGVFDSRNDDHRDDEDFTKHNKSRRRKRKLIRTKSYKSLPRFSSWRCGVFRFRLKLTRMLRIRIGVTWILTLMHLSGIRSTQST